MDDARRVQLRTLLENPVFSIDAPDDVALHRYDQALTHSSYGDADNERMEFFGDCVLDFLIGRELYGSFDRRSLRLRERFPALKDEALLTDMLHEITNDRNLAAIAGNIPGFDAAIRRGPGQQLTPSIRAGAFEALVAAICDDRGIEKTGNVIRELFRDRIEHAEPIVSWKNKLQECVQKQEPSAKVSDIIQYRTSREEGTPDHDARHYSEVYVRLGGQDWERWGTGHGRRGKDAEMDAARDAVGRHCVHPHS